jgi:hypothetical protein
MHPIVADGAAARALHHGKLNYHSQNGGLFKIAHIATAPIARSFSAHCRQAAAPAPVDTNRWVRDRKLA